MHYYDTLLEKINGRIPYEQMQPDLIIWTFQCGNSEAWVNMVTGAFISTQLNAIGNERRKS